MGDFLSLKVASLSKIDYLCSSFCEIRFCDAKGIWIYYAFLMSSDTRQKEIYQVTLLGSVVNLMLVGLKFAAGILGASAAMVADAVHSLSDLFTDFIVLIFVRISGRPADDDHHYGHGKYETLATTIVGLSLLVVGALLMANAIQKILLTIDGNVLEAPGRIALWAALASIILKELVYQITVRVGHRQQSDAVIANAWHHRSDALSSIGTAIGIGGAILFGNKWTVLDPIAAIIVSIFIVITAAKLLKGALQDLLEKSLPPEVEQKIRDIVAEDKQLSEMHHLRTRRVGNIYSIEMHLRMPGDTSLYEAHHHTVLLEERLRQQYGQATLINIHIEPIKVNGAYNPCVS